MGADPADWKSAMHVPAILGLKPVSSRLSAKPVERDAPNANWYRRTPAAYVNGTRGAVAIAAATSAARTPVEMNAARFGQRSPMRPPTQAPIMTEITPPGIPVTHSTICDDARKSTPIPENRL